ncbi:DUF3024 family protein [Tamaricihabitans halophyticus]|uniref:DUF3024 family protein n=1 Tax=Tamaricihabitans halophyticus TaxID=1262583 RepID=A0A4R2R500_9PSEU|nr:DUF3024 domain-containing protein [Tamaricihabitans halophyticus]TCP57097.1 DUF3024 family protein [Tamaricihabitans halophyticus]
MTRIPELVMKQVERWCTNRVPDRLREELRVTCKRRGNSITIVEQRAPATAELGEDWSEQKVAQLRLAEDGNWSLHWADRNGRWRNLSGGPRDETIAPLLDEIDRNPDGVFWG